MTSQRRIRSLLAQDHRRSAPFSVKVGDKTITGTFTALPYMRWHELLASHPARDGNAADEGWGFSVETFWPAAIQASAEFDAYTVGEDEWPDFLDMLPLGEIVRLGSQVFVLNVRAEAEEIPKSLPDSSGTKLADSA